MAANNLALEALLAGPRLIGRSPLAFIAWVGVRLVEQYASLAILLATRLGGAAPGVGAVWAVLIALPFEAVLVAGILRALLKPEKRAFAFLRLSVVEANMAGLLVLAGLVGAIIAVPGSIAAAYIAFALKQQLLAGSALVVGSVVAALAMMRLRPRRRSWSTSGASTCRAPGAPARAATSSWSWRWSGRRFWSVSGAVSPSGSRGSPSLPPGPPCFRPCA
jgi:hypothetical protein